MSKDLYMQMQQEIINISNQAVEGELSNLDALIELRERKTKLETGLELIKKFEDERLNEIAHEASQYPDGYRGYEVREVNGRKMYSYKGIPEIEEASNGFKQLQDKYQSAYEGVIKGTVQTTEVDGIKFWIDTDGELHPLPELNIGKSYLTVKQKIK